MKLSDIYDQFSIPDNLRTHMLRVAGVGGVICENLSSNIKIDKDVLIKALLVHDMGNIVKFDFSVKSIHTDLNEISRLKQIQSEFITKYSPDAHKTTESILKEIGFNSNVISITNNMVIKQLGDILKKNQLSLMTAVYADYKVAPNGIVSIEDRLNDLVSRYKNNNKSSSNWSIPEKVEEYRINLTKCEEIIQEYCSINLKDINDEMVEDYFDNFLKWDIN